MKTLEDILKESESQEPKQALRVLLAKFDEQEQSKLEEFSKQFITIKESNGVVVGKLDELNETLKQILVKPDPSFPEPKESPEIQKVSMDRPEWQKEAEPFNYDLLISSLAKIMVPLFGSLIETISINSEKTMKLLGEVLNKEVPIAETEVKNRQPMNLGSIRRRARWIRASTAKGTILGVIDGVNTVFYLPSGCITNSETVIMNQGVPMSNGVDYNILGNKITFVLPPPVQNPVTEIEVHFQT